MPGFLGFELLRPPRARPATSSTRAGRPRRTSAPGSTASAFTRGHAQAAKDSKGTVAHGSALLEFEVEQAVGPRRLGRPHRRARVRRLRVPGMVRGDEPRCCASSRAVCAASTPMALAPILRDRGSAARGHLPRRGALWADLCEHGSSPRIVIYGVPLTLELAAASNCSTVPRARAMAGTRVDASLLAGARGTDGAAEAMRASSSDRDDTRRPARGCVRISRGALRPPGCWRAAARSSRAAKVERRRRARRWTVTDPPRARALAKSRSAARRDQPRARGPTTSCSQVADGDDELLQRRHITASRRRAARPPLESTSSASTPAAEVSGARRRQGHVAHGSALKESEVVDLRPVCAPGDRAGGGEDGGAGGVADRRLEAPAEAVAARSQPDVQPHVVGARPRAPADGGACWSRKRKNAV